MNPLHIFCLFIFSLLTVKGFDCFSQQTVFTLVPPPGVGSGFQGTLDPKGYMWFGGTGVHRYDGYSYKSYFNDPLDTTSLSFNRIQSILADRKGFIWVGTNGRGLDRLDPETGIFTHFRHKPNNPNSLSDDTITVILEDRDGKIWAGTEGAGLNCLDPKTGTITRFRHNPNDTNSLSNDQVRALYEDRLGTIWVGTGFPYTGDLKWKEGGLNRFNPANKKFTRFLHEPKDPSSLIDNRVGTIFEDSKGRFWVGTAGDGLHNMNREKGSFERHQYNASNPNGLSRPPVRNTEIWLDDLITFIREDAAGAIWIGTFSGGLNRYDPETGKMSYYASLKEKSTDKNEVSTFWWSNTSKDGVLWIGAWEGIYRMDPLKKQIPHYDAGSNVVCLLQDSTGKLWLGTDKGLIVYDPATRNKKAFVYDISDTMSLSSNYVSSIVEDRSGTIWLGTGNVLYSYDRQSQKFTHYPIKHVITIIYEDSEGSFWIGLGENGLVQMNRQAGVFTSYRQSTTDTTSLSQNSIACIMEDREGYLWIGTGEGGLNRFDKKSKRFQHYLPGTFVHSIFQDADETLWIGTNRGLYYFAAASNSFVLFYNLGAGFTENIAVYHILEDDQHSLWVNTSVGLFQLSQNRREIGFFGKRHDMITQRWTTQKSCFKGKGGELFFSDITGNGYYAFFPLQLKGNAKGPELHITGFRLGDQLVVPGKAGPLRLPLSQTKEIRLSYNQNVFSFEFAAIHYSSPEDNRHLFMLENLDNDWRKAGEEKTAYYYKVPPGHYVFRVKAASSDGVWAEKSIDIIIIPPWWSGWWFRISAVFCVVALLYGFIRWRLHQKFSLQLERAEKENQLANLRHKTAELEMQALRAQMNPHFIFNSLNSINRFILQNNKAQASEYLTKFSRLVRLILQNSQASLIPLESELESLKLYLELEAVRFDHHFEFKITTDDELDTDIIKVPPLIIQPYAENAIWHGLMHKEEKGHLDIELFQQVDTLCCRITDDGIGRKKAAELKSKSASTHKSMGMQITASRIQMLQQKKQLDASIKITDLVLADGSAGGTEVMLKIPIIQ